MSAIIHFRCDEDIKTRATKTVDAMGISLSDVLRLFLVRVVEEQRIPFEVRVPNAETRAAMRELEEGKTQSFDNIRDALRWCDEED